MAKQILNTAFISQYRHEMVKTMKQINPSWDEDEIAEIVNKMIKKNFKNPSVLLDNNYTEEQRETSLLSVFEWAMERKPIIAGNGTFYKNQHEAANPIAEMLDSFLINRSKYKKQMFAITDTSSAKYRDFDLKQGNQKILANSYYGASGAPSSAFYSLHSGPATTLTAQSVISTAQNFFESFLADNYIFLDSTELFFWMGQILSDEVQCDDFIQDVTLDEVHDRLYSKIMQREKTDSEMLRMYLSNLSQNDLNILFYKNNIIGFLDSHRNIANIIYMIMEKVPNLDYVDSDEEGYQLHNMTKKEWNSYVNNQYFMNPNKAPDVIIPELDLFKKYIMKYVFTKYLSFDRIYRLRNFKRRVATIIDTDSNILSIDILINWILENIICGETFGRDKQHNDFVIVNTITYVITDAIRDILLYYGEKSNIPEEYRERFKMKNEFYMPLLIIGLAKKRYISKILLREGNLMNPPKNDIKGFDFKKATCSEYAEKRFKKIIKERIIDAPTINLHGINEDLLIFEKEIRNSILSGDIFFLPNGSAKELAAYKDPASEQSVRGTLAWNILYPDNSITLPSKVAILKMNIFTLEDIDDLKETNPDVYQKIKTGIFEDETGIFVSRKWESDEMKYVNPKTTDKKWTQQIPKKYRTKFNKLTPRDWNDFIDTLNLDDDYSGKGHYVVKSRGMQVLAIPSNARIPDWAIKYIDLNLMVNTIISPFKGVLELFGNQFVEEGKSRNGVNRKAERFTNIVKF